MTCARFAPDVQREFTRHQQHVNIAQERRLGPSLQDSRHADHVFETTAHGFRFGTRVPYSRAHNQYRRTRGQSDFMRIPPAVLTRMMDHVAEWVLRGGRA